MNDPLHLKYRPRLFKDVFQKNIIKALKNAIKNERVPPTTIFCGWSGVGKTTVARIYAMAMNCENLSDQMEPCLECRSCKSIINGSSLDIVEINAASKTGINDVREEIENTISLSPMPGPYRIYIMDECHKLSSAAQNALLKILEEPPNHARFILCTTEVDSIITTIQNRSHIYSFKRVNSDTIANNLKDICDQEQWDYDKDALDMIALASNGSPRNSVKMLDQICSDKITVEDVEAILGVSLRGLTLDILDNAIKGKVGELIKIVDALNSEGKNLILVLNQLCDNFDDILRIKCGIEVDASPEILSRLTVHADQINKTAIISGSKVLIELQKSITYRNISQSLVLETGFVDLALAIKNSNKSG